MPSRSIADHIACYARPLIGDLWPAVPPVDKPQRPARLQRIVAPQKLPPCVPQAYR